MINNPGYMGILGSQNNGNTDPVSGKTYYQLSPWDLELGVLYYTL